MIMSYFSKNEKCVLHAVISGGDSNMEGSGESIKVLLEVKQSLCPDTFFSKIGHLNFSYIDFLNFEHIFFSI